MKRRLKLFVIYFPVILVSGQVLANLLSFYDKSFYYHIGFYLNTFFGTNVLFAFFLLAFTFLFNFCAVSRWCAIAECLFATYYLIIQKDNLDNIVFQVIVGTLAIIATFWHFIKKFPLCRVSLLWNFIKSVISKGSCEKGIEEHNSHVKSLIIKNEIARHKY